MLAIKHVLFPVDFSTSSLAVAPSVKAMADRFGSKVTLMNVTHLVGPGEASNADPTASEEELRANAQSNLDSVLAEEFEHLAVECFAEVGDPAEVIARFANTQGVDLVMISTSGMGPFQSSRLGSVTTRVLHDALCPVWTSAHAQDSRVNQPEVFRSVLCAVDGTPKSTPLMRWAKQFAKKTGASLRLVHGIPHAAERSQEELEDRSRRFRVEISALQRSAGIEETPLGIVPAEVASAVREEAHRHSADLIIIGRGLLRETLTQTYRIILQSPCPVLSL